MKTSVKAAGFAALFVSLSLCATSVQARDTTHYFPIHEALEEARAQGLDTDIRLYFGNQKHPPVRSTIYTGITSNKKTSSANKTDQAACNRAMQSALIALQQAARNRGGNAVINIASYYNRRVYRSNSQFECHSGNIMSGVVLRGDIVRLR